MGRDIEKEILELRRKQKDIAAAIAVFERLEGQSQRLYEPIRKARATKSGTFIRLMRRASAKRT